MKMTQFAKFANDATKQILGDMGLERENLTHMFDYSVSFNPFPDSIPNEAGVKFIDYDGTVIYFVSRDEILSMHEMPPTVNHKTLIAQGWNWSLEDIKTYMVKYPDAIMTVGQMMLPADGKTHMILNVGPRLTIPLMIQQTVSNGITINWGDGTEEETIEGTGVVTTNHTYEAEGEYEITLDVADGCTLDFGDGTNNVFGESMTRMYITSLKEVFVGNGINSIAVSAFSGCYSLSTFTLPYGIISIGNRSFTGCYKLINFIIPNGVTSIGEYTFSNCYCLVNLSIPDSVISIGQSAFANCYCLVNLSIPNSIISIGQQAFYSCCALINLSIPNSVTTIEQNTFSYGYKINNLVIPKSVTSINKQALNGYYTLYTLTVLAETPPTLANVNAFSGMPADCTIYVPHGKGDTYKAASGWSTWASQIQELPE